jgi:hypothetical protein
VIRGSQLYDDCITPDYTASRVRLYSETFPSLDRFLESPHAFPQADG